MGRINNTQERIKIELIAEHRGRGKNNALILYPIDQLQIVRFIASLKDKKEKRFLLEFTLGAFKLKKSESKNEKKTSNEEKLDKLETMANTTKQQRLKRGIEKAKILGRGLSKLAKKGITGKALDTYYWKEALSRDHFSKAIGGVRVAYLNSKVNREPFRISFQKDPIDNNANLYREGANTVFRTVFHSTHFSGPGTAIFVISPEKILYAGSHEVGRFHHSSFLAGSAVLAAGEIRTNSQGEITWFSNKSGHYRPEKKQVINALEFFKSKGVDLSQVIFYNMQTYRSTNAQKFLETNQ